MADVPLLTPTAHDARDHSGVTGGGIAVGTSFPGSPSTDDLFHRSDRDLIYRYDGTRWVCICPHEHSGTQQTLVPTSVTSTTVQRWPFPQENGGIYVEKLRVVTFVSTTNNGSNYWTYTLDRRNAANANTNIGSFNTSADTVNNWVEHVLSVGAAYSSGTALMGLLTLTTTGSPGAAYALSSLVWRYIG